MNDVEINHNCDRNKMCTSPERIFLVGGEGGGDGRGV